jgi:rsbT antagonist protein RsbS
VKISILRYGDTLLTSIQVDLTDQDALEFQSDVLQMVRETEAQGIVVDITALDVVDSFMARIINDTAEMVRLLGSEVVVCGIQPAVALTLTEMGRELIGVETALNLEQGMGKVQRLIAARDGAAPPDEGADSDG